MLLELLCCPLPCTADCCLTGIEAENFAQLQACIFFHSDLCLLTSGLVCASPTKTKPCSYPMNLLFSQWLCYRCSQSPLLSSSFLQAGAVLGCLVDVTAMGKVLLCNAAVPVCLCFTPSPCVGLGCGLVDATCASVSRMAPLLVSSAKACLPPDLVQMLQDNV